MRLLKLSQLKLWQKLVVLVVAMSLPATVVGAFYVDQINARVDQAQAELAGSLYLRAIAGFESAVISHEGRAFALASGDSASRSALEAAGEYAERKLAILGRINRRLGERYGVRKNMRALRAQCKTLLGKKASATDKSLSSAHQIILQRVNRLRDAVAAGSLATSDPNPESRNLLVIASRYVPAVMLQEAALRRYAVDAAAKGYLGGSDRMGIEIARSAIESDMATIRATVHQLPESIRAPLSNNLQNANNAINAFYKAISEKILNANNVNVSVASIFSAGSTVHQTLERLMVTSGVSATQVLKARVASLRTARMTDLALVLLAVVLIHVLTWSIEHGLTTPLRHVVSFFERIAAGHYDNAIVSTRRDELGQVLSALASMQDKLRVQLENERLIAAENARIRQALDKTSTGVLLADAAHKIIYLNDAARVGFARHQEQFRRTLPGFEADSLQGAGLERLSPAPSEERSALDSLRSARSEERKYGDLHFRVTTSPVMDSHNVRIGTVMEWKERTQEVRVEREMRDVIDAVTSDDLSCRITLDDKTGFFATLGASVNRLTDTLADIVSRVKTAAREISLGAEEITTGNSNLSMRTEEQASSLEETASSMEEMTTTVKHNADNAGQANQLALAARDQAEQGAGVVDKAINAMTGIDQSARKIADIISVIDEIAFQTNLLALNAAVEAARAGEQGRGFAVVASEVRNLAGRSATAAKEIKGLIEDSVAKVTDGSRLVSESGRTLSEIVQSVKKVSDVVAEITIASREQSGGIEQVNRAVMQMDQITQQNSALVEQTIAAAKEMTGQVRSLNETLARFRDGNPASGSSSVGTSGQTQVRRAVGESR